MQHSDITIPNGTLSFDELLEEAMDGKSVEPSIAKACVTEFMKAVKRNVLKGFRCKEYIKQYDYEQTHNLS